MPGQLSDLAAGTNILDWLDSGQATDYSWLVCVLLLSCMPVLATAADRPSSSGRADPGDLGFKAFVSETEWRKIDKKVRLDLQTVTALYHAKVSTRWHWQCDGLS